MTFSILRRSIHTNKWICFALLSDLVGRPGNNETHILCELNGFFAESQIAFWQFISYSHHRIFPNWIMRASLRHTNYGSFSTLVLHLSVILTLNQGNLTTLLWKNQHWFNNVSPNKLIKIILALVSWRSLFPKCFVLFSRLNESLQYIFRLDRVIILWLIKHMCLCV